MRGATQIWNNRIITKLSKQSQMVISKASKKSAYLERKFKRKHGVK